MSWQPTLNAGFNALSAICLLSGYYFVRRREVGAHRVCMIGACTSSILFFISYIIYHSLRGSTRFMGEGPIRSMYFVILVTHTVLAVTVAPIVVITLRRALGRSFDRHRALARWTFPLWLYVSASGIVVYLLLYHLNPRG